jgi:hypothetical protein
LGASIFWACGEAELHGRRECWGKPALREKKRKVELKIYSLKNAPHDLFPLIKPQLLISTIS